MLDQFIVRYNGKKVGDGQCGTLVRAYWNEVDKTVPPSYLNSKDYWFNPVPGYDKSPNPIPGAIAIYNGHGSYTEGHSAIYVGNGIVFEQNADPDGSPAHEFVRANTYLLGYLIKQGAQMITVDQVDKLIKMGLNREPTQEELANKTYQENPGLAIDTFWNNGGKSNYETPPVNGKPVTKLSPGIYEV